MVGARHREEVINVKLADALASRGLDADAETIHVKGRPDVIVSLSGVKLVVEGRHTDQRISLLEDTRTRIKKAVGDISVAVEYQDELYTVPSPKLGAAIEAAKFSGCVCFFAASDIQENAFSSVSIDELALLIQNAFQLIVQNDVVRVQVSAVEDAITRAVERASGTNLFFKSGVVAEKLKNALAIDLQKAKEPNDGEEEE